MGLFKWLYPGMRVKRWVLLCVFGIILCSVGFVLTITEVQKTSGSLIVLLGAGIALAGSCPGTVLAQVGAGYRDALFTLAGGICGAVAYSYATPALSGTFLAAGSGKLVLSDLIGLPYWQGAITLAGIIVIVLFALEALKPWRAEMGNDVDGDMGAAGTSDAVRMAPAE